MMPRVTSFFVDRDFCGLTDPKPFSNALEAAPLTPQPADSEEARSYDIRFESSDRWEPIESPLRDSAPEFKRYVDGSAHLIPLAWGRDGEGFAAVVAGTTGALAGLVTPLRTLRTEPAAEWDHSARLVVGLSHYGMEASVIEALRAEFLTAANIHLFTRQISEPAADNFFPGITSAQHAARSAALESMHAQERISVAGIDGAPTLMTCCDGPLSSHLLGESDRRKWPLVGVVKKHSRLTIPSEVSQCVIRLPVGHRSPAMKFTRNGVSIVTWYLRLASDFGRTGLYGIIRAEVSEEYLQIAAEGNQTQWISDISARLYEARAYRPGYRREHCSLQPILLVEDRLHAHAGGEGVIWNLRKMLGLL
jgi:hypothetical protein